MRNRSPLPAPLLLLLWGDLSLGQDGGGDIGCYVPGECAAGSDILTAIPAVDATECLEYCKTFNPTGGDHDCNDFTYYSDTEVKKGFSLYRYNLFFKVFLLHTHNTVFFTRPVFCTRTAPLWTPLGAATASRDPPTAPCCPASWRGGAAGAPPSPTCSTWPPPRTAGQSAGRWSCAPGAPSTPTLASAC